MILPTRNPEEPIILGRTVNFGGLEILARVVRYAFSQQGAKPEP